jgi:hypothetical protein
MAWINSLSWGKDFDQEEWRKCRGNEGAVQKTKKLNKDANATVFLGPGIPLMRWFSELFVLQVKTVVEAIGICHLCSLITFCYCGLSVIQ